jgi:hypothetical protein
MIRVVNVKGLRGYDRNGICYVGRAFAGWPASPWGNPFRPRRSGSDGFGSAWSDPGDDVQDCLTRFREYASKQPLEWLSLLWEACEHGVKPLGCWCCSAAHGDGQDVVCHAQILANMLHERFIHPPMVDIRK